MKIIPNAFIARPRIPLFISFSQDNFPLVQLYIENKHFFRSQMISNFDNVIRTFQSILSYQCCDWRVGGRRYFDKNSLCFMAEKLLTSLLRQTDRWWCLCMFMKIFFETFSMIQFVKFNKAWREGKVGNWFRWVFFGGDSFNSRFRLISVNLS